MSSSKLQPTAIYHANIVHVKNVPKTWTSNSSGQLLMNATVTGQDHFHCTCLGNHSFTRISSRQSITLKPKTNDIPSFLQRMEQSLISLQNSYWKVELIESYGVGGSSILSFQAVPLKSSKESVWLGFSLKKPRKKSLKSGVSSRGLK